jgi:hypothetical protein
VIIWRPRATVAKKSRAVGEQRLAKAIRLREDIEVQACLAWRDWWERQATATGGSAD